MPIMWVDECQGQEGKVVYDLYNFVGIVGFHYKMWFQPFMVQWNNQDRDLYKYWCMPTEKF